MKQGIKRLAVLTSGSDGPGMNACIRSVVRMALHHGWKPWGVRWGYAGLLRGELVPLGSRDVSHIIGRGGTFLGASQSTVLAGEREVREALRNLNEVAIDALVVIGGDGSMRGAHMLSEAGFATVGIPATIENDVCGTEICVGADSALNTALDAIDRIKDTASARQQAFVLEVMGGKSGYLALMAGMGGGAEMVSLPEAPLDLEQAAEEVADAYVRGKEHCIIVVAEGADPNAGQLTDYLNEKREETGFEAYLTIVGSIQRGGSPTAYDRYLATCLGAEAAERLAQGQSGVMIGWCEGQAAQVPLAEVVDCVRAASEEDRNLARVLAR